jgi:hypothetical protein
MYTGQEENKKALGKTVAAQIFWSLLVNDFLLGR